MISDVSCDTDRGGYYNPNSSRDGGVGAPTGGAMRRWLIVDAVAVRVASSGSSLTSSAVTTAVTPSDDASCRSRVPTASAALYQDGATKDGGTDEGENDGS